MIPTPSAHHFLRLLRALEAGRASAIARETAHLRRRRVATLESLQRGLHSRDTLRLRMSPIEKHLFT